MAQLLQDFRPGPLDTYRKRASFDWKKLKVFIETEDVVRFQHELLELLKSHPEFQDDLLSPSFDEVRRIAARRALAHSELEILSYNRTLENLKRSPSVLRTMMQISPSSTVKQSIGSGMCTSVIKSLGTAKHQKLAELAFEGEVHFCFCLTEIGHGSNAKGMRTRATYDKEKQSFLLHTPDFEAAKCWAGNLGQIASYAIVYAQLYVGGEHHGLHTFLVPIRDPKTLIPFPGVVVGDMGEKIGLNGIDNGFLIFDNYYVSKDALLNKNSDVTIDGKFVTRYKSDRDRHGASLGALSVGRVNITGICEFYGSKALTIAIRYAAVRKQFGPENEEEVPILEYQSHQYRLLPYLAGEYVIRIFSIYLAETCLQLTLDTLLGNHSETAADLGMELHVVSSASKPVSSWFFRDAIQECREACGGHGYLKVAGIGDIRNDHDANLTYEGENHVLIQQTSNWLLKQWPLIEARKRINTPMKSSNFLSDALSILNDKFKATNIDEISRPETIIEAYRWLVCYLLKETKQKQDSLAKQQGEFWAKNNSQVFFAKSLAIAFVQHFFLQYTLEFINTATDFNVKNVLSKLVSLYGLFSLHKFLPSLYEGGYARGPLPTQLVQEGILKLCREIKDEAVALVDAIAPPDFILNSVLGMSDGQVYQHLQSAIFRSPYAMTRPSWWKEIVNWKSTVNNKL